ncbi:MAG: antirestriction protein ArdA [Oscillospiraceae bacterium]|nr:antirestriction protein ArdA [Oscillospiraceae bacterium]
MLGAVICNGSNTMVADLPAPSLDLESKLHSIGIIEPADKLPLKDEEGDQIRIKLYATSPEEAHLLFLLTPDRNLMEANLAAEMLQKAEREVQPRLKCGLLADRYTTLTDFFNEARMVPKALAQAKAVSKQLVNEAKAMTDFQRDPNIRVVVFCTRVVGQEFFCLPMNDPQLSAVFNRLDELGEGMYSLGIKACRYKDHWPDTFAEVLREEGLFALNALAAAFPPLEDYDKFCAVVEYADANDSKAYIALAESLDEFDFLPGVRDVEDVAREWLKTQNYLALSPELEEYFDFESYGSDLQDEYNGEFVSGGYVSMMGSVRLEDILSEAQDMDLQ